MKTQTKQGNNMGIRSEPFQGVVLSGEDIAMFERQVETHIPSAAAIATVRRGVQFAVECKEKGFVTFVSRPREKARSGRKSRKFG